MSDLAVPLLIAGGAVLLSLVAGYLLTRSKNAVESPNEDLPMILAVSRTKTPDMDAGKLAELVERSKDR